jgi:hypothetical protein
MKITLTIEASNTTCIELVGVPLKVELPFTLPSDTRKHKRRIRKLGQDGRDFDGEDFTRM